MSFWSNRAAEANERRSVRTEARGEARGERIAARADRSRAARIERASRGYTGRPLRTRTWVHWR